MIRVQQSPEPVYFDSEIREPGNTWLQNNPNPTKRPPNKWSRCCADLRDAFHQRCGYGAMYVAEGSIDHYRSWHTHRNLAYEWDNYRFCSSRMNSKKGTTDAGVLDPFEVQCDWFEILLPSLQLVPTDQIPASERARAEFTLRRMGLRDDTQIIKLRSEWYELYKKGDFSLDYLRRVAPLIAKAIDTWKSAHPDLPLP